MLREFNAWNWNWNLDSALRYAPIKKLLKKLPSKPRILEIGSGSRGAGRYIGADVHSVDLNFSSSVRPARQHRVRARGELLPFVDGSFELVICADVLEHIAPPRRLKILREALRCLDDGAFFYMTVPVGPASEVADKNVNELYRKKKGVNHPMLTDHLSNGLPTVDDLHSLLEVVTEFEVEVVKLQKITPIWLWSLNLKIFGAEAFIPYASLFQRLILRPLFPLLRFLTCGEKYRLMCLCRRAS